MSAKKNKVNVGDQLTAHQLTTIQGLPVRVPDGEHLVHLQFRRYAGCPICNLHLRAVARRNGEIETAGIREVVVFHSSAETMREFQGQLPFAPVADPDKTLYAEFGVGSSMKAVLHPHVWSASLRGSPAALRSGKLTKSLGAGEQHLGLPAEFLIDPLGRVLATKYGAHANDQWSVDELLATAGAA